MSLKSLDLVEDDVTVFRAVTLRLAFIPEGGTLPSEAFLPADADVEEAKERNFESPLASVWDVAKSSIEEVRKTREQPSRAFAVPVKAVRALKVEGLDPPEVYADPVDPKTGFGAGHCGISNLRGLESTRSKTVKRAYQSIRGLLADLAKPIEPMPDIPKEGAA
jgi:hypothetical protein